MAKYNITIKDMPIEIFDAILEKIYNGNPNKKILENAKEKMLLLRNQFQVKLDERMEKDNRRPKEEMRVISANPTSYEHKK